jgi:hypothetical protein
MAVFTVIALGATVAIQAFTLGMLVSTYISVCQETKTTKKGDK